jgi:hypothetical protein
MSSNNYFKFSLTALALAATVAFAPTSSAALATYTQNFEGMTPNQGYPPNDLSNDGWQIYGIVYDANPYNNPSANITGEYGPFDAANGDPGSIQGVATGEGGPSQGAVVLAKYTDYNNQGVDGVGGLADGYVSASTYQEQVIGIDDVGSIWRFSYDAKMGNLVPDSSAFAYILAQDFIAQTEIFLSNDSTNMPVEWGRYSIDLLITAELVGDNLSFGFGATATGNNGSGIFYDNLEFAEVSQVPVPAAVWLFGSGLIGLVGVARRRKH